MGLFFADPLFEEFHIDACAIGSQRSAFDKAAALLEPAGQAIEIPLEEARMPGYLFRAEAGERRPPEWIAILDVDADGGVRVRGRRGSDREQQPD